MKLIPSNGISIGQRDEQQDEFGFSDPLNEVFVQHGGVLAVVVDGMGGVRHGSECARAGKAAFLHAYESKQPSESVRQALERSLITANDAVLAVARRHEDPKGVGATLTAAVVWRERLIWISVGDSAIYVLRNGLLQRLTASHDTVGVDGQAYISSFLGLPQLTTIDLPVNDVLLQVGDRVLACSDGLFRSLSESQMAHVLATAPPGDAGPALVNAALSMQVPGQDNVTAIVLSCEADGTPSPITSNVSPTTRRWQIAAIIVFAVILFGASGAYGWYRYRSFRDGRQVGELIDQVTKAFEAGDCAAALQLRPELIKRAADGAKAVELADRCDRFVKAVREGDAASQQMGAATGAERRRLHEQAVRAYRTALAEQVPAAASDVVRRALSRLEQMPQAEEKVDPEQSLLDDPSPPRGPGTAKRQAPRPQPKAAPPSDDETRQPIRKKPSGPGGM